MKNLLSVLLLSLVGAVSPASADWYRAVAQPNLVVRASPDVSASKLGNVPYGGKVDVIGQVGGMESIGGRSGHWVKIHWKNGKGYVFDAFLDTVDEDEGISSASSTSRSSSQSSGAQWFRSNASPSLVVRSSPDVSASKVGNVPTGGKVKVLKVVSSRESIGGRTGRWVKIEWKSTTGYVFDAFLEPADSVRTGISTQESSSKMDREIAMQLELFGIAAEKEGYNMTGNVMRGKLYEGNSKTYRLKLHKGMDYRILTACDGNCNDLDSELADDDGNSVAVDVDNDSLPMLSASPEWTGEFNLSIRMIRCGKAPCSYGVAVFGR